MKKMISDADWAKFQASIKTDATFKTLCAHGLRMRLKDFRLPGMVEHAQRAWETHQRLSPSTLRQPTRWSKALLRNLVAAGVLAEAELETVQTTGTHSKALLKESKRALEPITRLDAKLAHPSPSPEPLLSQASLSELCEALARKIASHAEDLVAESIRKTLALESQLSPLSPQEESVGSTSGGSSGVVSAHRVLVVGLLPAQAAILAARVAQLPVHLRCEDAASANLKEHARWADHVFVMTKFVSHDTSRRLKPALTESGLTMSNGGVTGLVEQIRHWLSSNS